MSELRITSRRVDALIPYARNSRTHSPEQVAQIAASIREFGWTNPVLVDGANGIIAGHGRVLAARKLSLDEVPVIELAHMSETQKRAYIIADNKLAEQAGWDSELLALELGELQAEGFDLDLLGFGDAELGDLLNLNDDTESTATEARATLAERFMIAPFTVLDARRGWWQERKRAWLAMGLRSEAGRDERLPCTRPRTATRRRSAAKCPGMSSSPPTRTRARRPAPASSTPCCASWPIGGSRRPVA